MNDAPDGRSIAREGRFGNMPSSSDVFVGRDGSTPAVDDAVCADEGRAPTEVASAAMAVDIKGGKGEGRSIEPE